MSRGLSTVHQLKVIHKSYCSLYLTNITSKTCGSQSSFSHLASASVTEDYKDVKFPKCSKKLPGHLPYLALDLNFVRQLSTDFANTLISYHGIAIDHSVHFS